jgi:hypothetical protein
MTYQGEIPEDVGIPAVVNGNLGRRLFGWNRSVSLACGGILCQRRARTSPVERLSLLRL